LIWRWLGVRVSLRRAEFTVLAGQGQAESSSGCRCLPSRGSSGRIYPRQPHREHAGKAHYSHTCCTHHRLQPDRGKHAVARWMHDSRACCSASRRCCQDRLRSHCIAWLDSWCRSTRLLGLHRTVHRHRRSRDRLADARRLGQNATAVQDTPGSRSTAWHQVREAAPLKERWERSRAANEPHRRDCNDQLRPAATRLNRRDCMRRSDQLHAETAWQARPECWVLLSRIQSTRWEKPGWDRKQDSMRVGWVATASPSRLLKLELDAAASASPFWKKRLRPRLRQQRLSAWQVD
jgi:hypothetical protein